MVSEINPGYNFGYHYFSPTNLLSQFSFASGKPMRTIKKAIEIYNKSIDFCLDNIESDQFSLFDLRDIWFLESVSIRCLLKLLEGKR